MAVHHQLTGRFILSLAVGIAAWSAEAPRKAPELQFHMPDGKTASLTALRGKKVCAVAFISTTCPHCQAYIQTLNGIQKDYAEKGVQIVAVAFNPGADKALAPFIEQFKPTFPVGWDPDTAVLDFLQMSILKPGYVPKVAFIDRSGNIRLQVNQADGPEEFFREADKSTRAELDELLKAPAPHRPTTSAAKKTVNTAAKK